MTQTSRFAPYVSRKYESGKSESYFAFRSYGACRNARPPERPDFEGPVATAFARSITQKLEVAAQKLGYEMVEIQPIVAYRLPGIGRTMGDFGVGPAEACVIGFQKPDGRITPVVFGQTSVTLQSGSGPMTARYSTDTNFGHLLESTLTEQSFI